MIQPSAIVAGAGRGIGRAVAAALAQKGYHLTLAARTAGELEQTAARAGGAEVCQLCPADLTDPEAAERLIAQAVQRFGRVDALVNCVGVAPPIRIEHVTTAQWREILDSNLSAVFYLCRAVWPHMQRQRGGVIVNLSSLAAFDPFPGLGVYGAAKAGLNTLGLVMAREGEADGIRVHTIAPGAVETQMFRKLMTEQQVPADRTLAPQEVAALIVRCVTGELAATSGEVIRVHKTVT